jgi:Holliday junction resolvase
MRRAAKIDVNQPELVKAFRTLGCSVLSLAAVGKGVPDLLVSIKGITWLVEVKMPKGKETQDQVEFAANWQGCRAIVRDVAGVATVFKIMVEQSRACNALDMAKFSE